MGCQRFSGTAEKEEKVFGGKDNKPNHRVHLLAFHKSKKFSSVNPSSDVLTSLLPSWNVCSSGRINSLITERQT